MSLSDSEAAFIVFISTFIILSFLSNVFVVVVMMKIKTMRTVTNMFLTNLAVSDMILVSVILPLQVFDISHTDEYDECKLHVACPVLLCIVKPRENQSPKKHIRNSYGFKRFHTEIDIGY